MNMSTSTLFTNIVNIVHTNWLMHDSDNNRNQILAGDG